MEGGGLKTINLERSGPYFSRGELYFLISDHGLKLIAGEEREGEKEEKRKKRGTEEKKNQR